MKSIKVVLEFSSSLFASTAFFAFLIGGFHGDAAAQSRVDNTLSGETSIVWEGISVDLGHESTVCEFSLRYPSVSDVRLKHFPLSDPQRIVVDIDGVQVSKPKRFDLRGKERCIAGVRFGRHPSSTRIVFDLRDEVGLEYSVKQVENALVFSLGSQKAIGDYTLSESHVEKITTPAIAFTAAPLPTVIPSPTFIALATVAQAVDIATPVVLESSAGDIAREENLVSLVEPTVADSPRSVVLTVGNEQRVSKELVSSKDPVEIIETPEGRVFKQTVRPDLRFKVDQVLIELGAPAPAVKNLSVTNISDQVLHMTTRAVALIKPGTENEEEVKTENLLVSPLMFELQPGEQRKVRLVGVKSAPDIEETFRVHLAPLQDDFDTTINLKLSGVEARLNVVTALAITVLRAPAQPKPVLKETRSPGQITLTNVGNQHIALTEIKLCNEISPRDCRELPSRRIYPDASLTFDLPKGVRIEMLQQTGADFQPLRLEGLN